MQPFASTLADMELLDFVLLAFVAVIAHLLLSADGGGGGKFSRQFSRL